jgi:hypothetical protein
MVEQAARSSENRSNKARHRFNSGPSAIRKIVLSIVFVILCEFIFFYGRGSSLEWWLIGGLVILFAGIDTLYELINE